MKISKTIKIAVILISAIFAAIILSSCLTSDFIKTESNVSATNTETTVSMASATNTENNELTTGIITKMYDYVHHSDRDTSEVYMIEIENNNQIRKIRVTSLTFSRYKIGDTFTVHNHIYTDHD